MSTYNVLNTMLDSSEIKQVQLPSRECSRKTAVVAACEPDGQRRH